MLLRDRALPKHLVKGAVDNSPLGKKKEVAKVPTQSLEQILEILGLSEK